jgi:hypothetical protein
VVWEDWAAGTTLRDSNHSMGEFLKERGPPLCKRDAPASVLPWARADLNRVHSQGYGAALVG